ncbi:MAG: hypothetical protein HQK53_11940 [Oligoflexia bacterium]|nr:hypothetical protein [Oligoflexia bacterium]
MNFFARDCFLLAYKSVGYVMKETVPQQMSVILRNDKNVNVIDKTLIQKCHVCGEIIESCTEIKMCPQCHHSFLPGNCTRKIIDLWLRNEMGSGSGIGSGSEKSSESENVNTVIVNYAKSNEMEEENLVVGIQVLW